MYVHSDSASGVDVPKWYYANAGTRSGPHSDDEMARLARSGTLGAATLCWTDSYGEQWKPFSQTELGSRVAGDVLPSAFLGVTDVYVWTYAAIPTVGGFIVSFLASAQFGDYATLYLLALVPYGVMFALLAVMDARQINRTGIRRNGRKLSPMGFIIAPIYLWQRATFTDRSKAPFWVFIGPTGIGVLVLVAFLTFLFFKYR